MLSIPPLKAPRAGPLARPVPRPLDIDPSCVLYYSLIDPLSRLKVLDESPAKNNGILNGPTWQADGLGFDGVDNYVDAGNDTVLNLSDAVATFMVTIKTTETVNRDIMVKSGGVTFWLVRVKALGNTLVQMYDGTSTLSRNSALKVNDGELHCIIGVLENGVRADVYVDGVLSNAAGSANTINTLAPTNNAVIARGDLSGGYLNGTIAEAAIFNRALKSYEVENMAAQSREWYGW